MMSVKHIKIPTLSLIFVTLICDCCMYHIYRDSCRRYALFKIAKRGARLSGRIGAALSVPASDSCLKTCLETSNCLTFNFNSDFNTNNCEILTKQASTGSYTDAEGWKHYEAVEQTVTPGCIMLGDAQPCSPGYRCEDRCTSNNIRFQCIDIDECISSPCYNGGTCLNLENRFKCQCVAGYRGNLCGININECNSSPCLNGGACTDLINGYQCSCPAGFAGARCETNINECASNTCVHGSCHDHVNRFSCSCNGGYNGDRCQYDINECASNPCQWGGVCHNHINHFTCACPFGRVGSVCQCLLLCGKK